MAEETEKAEDQTPAKEKYFADQFDDEEVLFVFHKHPIVMRKGLVFGLLGPLLGVLPAAFKPELGFGFFFGGLIVGCVLGLLIFAPSWISWHFSVFIMTDQRFIQITQKGLWNRAVADLALAQIQSVNYEVKGLQETLLGFGTIKMQTYVGDLVIHDVHRPARIQKQLLGILREEGITTHPYPKGSPNRAADTEAEPEAETD
ncbi:MAG TPA: PH domain-containing protein [Candidatus Saccharimonadales bacterium]|nr:PH domain-containing protein [Candidatus Saccharimonadales bacterium]